MDKVCFIILSRLWRHSIDIDSCIYKTKRKKKLKKEKMNDEV